MADEVRDEKLKPSPAEGPGATREKLGDMGKGSFEQSQDADASPPDATPGKGR